ncbi:MAG: hypothetical protein ACLPID_07230 [Beijerinckiaceae bacterium]
MPNTWEPAPGLVRKPMILVWVCASIRAISARKKRNPSALPPTGIGPAPLFNVQYLFLWIPLSGARVKGQKSSVSVAFSALSNRSIDIYFAICLDRKEMLRFSLTSSFLFFLFGLVEEAFAGK